MNHEGLLWNMANCNGLSLIVVDYIVIAVDNHYCHFYSGLRYAYIHICIHWYIDIYIIYIYVYHEDLYILYVLYVYSSL